MSQVSKEIGDFADNDSIGAQSHALVDQNSSYAFAIGTDTGYNKGVSSPQQPIFGTCVL